MCMYVFASVCMHVHACTCMHVCVLVPICMRACMRVCVRVYMFGSRIVKAKIGNRRLVHPLGTTQVDFAQIHPPMKKHVVCGSRPFKH